MEDLRGIDYDQSSRWSDMDPRDKFLINNLCSAVWDRPNDLRRATPPPVGLGMFLHNLCQKKNHFLITPVQEKIYS